MALKSTVYKADLQITDMDRRYFKGHNLTVAQHPSETDERMMVRILAFVLNANDQLEYGKGLSSDDEAALWSKDYTGRTTLWIDVGLPDEDRIRKASNSADKVIVYTYGGNAANLWWEKIFERLYRFKNLTVINLPEACTRNLGQLVDRTMQLYCTVQDGQAWIANKDKTIQVDLQYKKRIDE